jgi:pimeloyl-ACP methyl ester carboxylesterase
MKKFISILLFLLCVSALVAQNRNQSEKKIKVFILSGQSNMAGMGNSVELPDKLRYGTENKLMFEEGKWQKLKPHKPTHKKQRELLAMTEFSFGPEISFATEISKANSNETIGIIKSARGGTGILAWSPNWTIEQANRSNDGKKGDLYKVLIDKVKAAQKSANIEIVGFLWQQGGKDMTKLSLAKEYFDNLNAMITGIRRDLDLPDLPVFIGCSVSEKTLKNIDKAQKAQLEKIQKTRPGIEYVIRARFKAEEKIPNVKVVVTPDLEKHPKNVHYNTNGQLALGKLYAEAFIENQWEAEKAALNETLEGINERFEHVDVELIEWPDELHKKLGKQKKIAFMASPVKKPAGKLPLIISLHGAGGRKMSLEQQLARSAEVKGLGLAELAGKDLILLEPNTAGFWDVGSLNTMLDYVLENYQEIDANRVYVMGHSMGGYGTWAWINESTERFAAAAPCGFSASDTGGVEHLINLPIWGMVGGDDKKDRTTGIKKMVERLRAAGNKHVKHTEFPGANHAGGNATVFSSVELVEWMLGFSKGK